MGMGDLKKCVYQFVYNEKDSGEANIIQYLLCMDWYYVSR